MITLLSPNFVLEKVTTYDLIVASTAWGFTLGIGWLTTWTAAKQTASVYRRRGLLVFRNAYIWMIWLEISVCLGFGVICFMYLLDVIPPSFAFYFCILTLWALQVSLTVGVAINWTYLKVKQVQFLLQIIINRCAILVHDKKSIWRVKYGVAALITTINVSVYCIWIPARLQVSERYIHINDVWDRCEKVIYLIVDACLNFLFIRIVKKNLVELGLSKYDNVVKFNLFIIGFSLSMDVLIVSMMSLKNTFVYMQFHPLAYIVKLNIEMSMARLIAKISKSSSSSSDYAMSRSRGTRAGDKTWEDRGDDRENARSKAWPTVTTTVEMHTLEAQPSTAPKAQIGFHPNDTDELLRESLPYSVQVQAAYATSASTSMHHGNRSASSSEFSGVVGAAQ